MEALENDDTQITDIVVDTNNVLGTMDESDAQQVEVMQKDILGGADDKILNEMDDERLGGEDGNRSAGDVNGESLDHTDSKTLGVTDGEACSVIENKTLSVTDGKDLGVADGKSQDVTHVKSLGVKRKFQDDGDDGGAASEEEFAAADDRTDMENVCASWTWHIEFYPIGPEDVMFENFARMMNASDQSHVIFRSNEQEKRGEAHFYTNSMVNAKLIMRSICCRKFACIRPFVYLYHKTGEDECESAVMRVDVIEAAKMRWDKPKTSKGEVVSFKVKVGNVPEGISKEFVSVLFSRVYSIAPECENNEGEHKPVDGDESTASKSEDTKVAPVEKGMAESKKINNADEQSEDLVGNFNGDITLECGSRHCLKSFLLGYRRVTIDNKQLTFAVDDKEFDFEALRREVRKKRCYEAIHGKEWKVDGDEKDEQQDNPPSRPERGGRGGRGGGFRGGRGRIMTGRGKMNEKMTRRGEQYPRDDDDGRIIDSMRHLENLQRNTFELQRHIESLQALDHGFGGYPRDHGPGRGWFNDFGGQRYGGGQGGKFSRGSRPPRGGRRR